MADTERAQSTQEQARGLGSDLRSIYGIRGGTPNMFSAGGGAVTAPATAAPAASTAARGGNFFGMTQQEFEAYRYRTRADR